MDRGPPRALLCRPVLALPHRVQPAQLVGIAKLACQRVRRRVLYLVASKRVCQHRYRLPRIRIMTRDGAVTGSPPRSAISRWCRRVVAGPVGTRRHRPKAPCPRLRRCNSAVLTRPRGPDRKGTLKTGRV